MGKSNVPISDYDYYPYKYYVCVLNVRHHLSYLSFIWLSQQLIFREATTRRRTIHTHTTGKIRFPDVATVTYTDSHFA